MTPVIIFCAKFLFLAASLLVAVVFVRVAPKQRRILLVRALVVLVLSVALAKGGGALYKDPRPFVIRHVTPIIPHEPDNGFPSDHALLIFACAFLLLPFSLRAGLVTTLIAVVVGVARVACLLHTPADIVASGVFAAVANVVAWRLVGLRPASRWAEGKWSIS